MNFATILHVEKVRCRQAGLSGMKIGRFRWRWYSIVILVLVVISASHGWLNARNGLLTATGSVSHFSKIRIIDKHGTDCSD